MIPLGFFQVLVILVLIQLRIGESLAIPLISEPRQIHGVLAEKHTFIHLSGRERRDIQCQVGHYLHPNGTHCCIKCHKEGKGVSSTGLNLNLRKGFNKLQWNTGWTCLLGTYLSEHCSGPDKAPTCSVCPEGTYMPTENYSQKCFACQPCRTSFQQIIKFRCTKWENTLCGCDSNQYKTTRNAEFLCNNCSDCHNGKIRKDCTPDSDTICECHGGFFLKEDQNKCLPCSSCDKEDCKKRCRTEMVKSPSNSKELISVLSFLTIIFAVGFLALTFLAIKKYFPERLNFSSCSDSYSREVNENIATWLDSCGIDEYMQESEGLIMNEKAISKTSGQQSKKQLASKPADKAKNSLLDIKEEMISATTQVLSLSQAQDQELPDCIKSARETRISDSPVVLYAVVNAVPVVRWKEFMRYLGLSENTIERIFLDHQHRRDAQYETLKEWRLLANHDASMERINQVLSKMDLSGCIEDIQEALAKQ